MPPLRYGTVYQLKRDFPSLQIILNGGVSSLAAAQIHLAHVDGVMIGREAYHNPYLLADADGRMFGLKAPTPTREQVLDAYIPYVQRQLQQGEPLHRMVRHILGLYRGVPGAKLWRRHLSEQAAHRSQDVEIIREAMHLALGTPSRAAQRTVPESA